MTEEAVLSRKASSSLFVTIATGAGIGLLLPALIVGGLLIGWYEPQVAQASQQRELEAKLDVLASSLPELLWNLDQVAAREVVAALMKSPDVVKISVTEDSKAAPFIEVRLTARQLGRSTTGERDIYRGTTRIGHIEMEIDDHLSSAALARERWLYAATVGGQLLASLALLLWLLNSRLLRPLRALGRFANDLAEGRFSAQLKPGRSDEIGQLGSHLEHMRAALQQQFEAQQALIVRLSGIAETVPGVVYQLRLGADGQFAFTYVSEAVKDYFQLTAAELSRDGSLWFSQIHPLDRQAVGESLLASARQLQPWQQEFRSHRSAQTEPAEAGERWLYGNAIAQADGQGGVLWHGFLTDISRQRRDAQELLRHRLNLEELVEARTAELALATQAAQTANQAKSAFLANMSHEIRTPMNAIIGLTYLVHRDSTEPVQQTRLQMVSDAAVHLLGIINNVLDFSKIEAGKMRLQRAAFTVSQVLDTTSSLLTHTVAGKNLQLQLDVDEALSGQSLLGDGQRITEILLNFANNAVKFTDSGFVRLSARCESEDGDTLRLRFEVQDSGIGIAATDQARLFQDFEQADSSTTRRYGGTGLGLAICRRLAELMHGEVGLRSELGQGSCFWLSLPLEKSDLPSAAGTAVSAARLPPLPAGRQLLARFNGRRVLLAEDNAVNQEVAVALLNSVGLQVDIASDGEEAVQMASRFDYALVLMDVQMPVMDGLDATRAIRRSAVDPQVPILAMTANAFAEERERCLDAGMNDHVAKPVVAEHLFSTLHFWLSRKAEG